MVKKNKPAKTAKKALVKRPIVRLKPVASSYKRHPILDPVSQNHYFVLVSGRQLKDLLELVEAFEDMEDWEFHHHVNPERNDFSNWIREIIKEEDLAQEISQSWNRHDAQRRLLKYLIKKIS